MKKLTATIYLIGFSGTGKYTIAKELAKSNFRIADNQLINNPIFELVGYDGTGDVSKEAWNTIAEVREAIFKFITQDRESNYVLTNVLSQDKGDLDLYNQVKTMAEIRGSVFIPVKLTISPEENNKRIVNPERKLRFKQIVPSADLHLLKLIEISHPNLLTLDVTNISSYEASKIILEHTKNCSKSL